jgi:hypothetical protein
MFDRLQDAGESLGDKIRRDIVGGLSVAPLTSRQRVTEPDQAGHGARRP